MTELSPVVIIAGPTASGKSALALTVAEVLGADEAALELGVDLVIDRAPTYTHKQHLMN